MNNVKNSIGWADFTWNPITGCKRGCTYCYARRLHERFNKNPFSEIVLHPERFNDPEKTKKPSIIFVGSMSDVEYWPKEQLKSILAVCRDLERHTFMFLSKNPKSYINGFPWPKNTMQGLTLESLKDGEDLYKIKQIIQMPRPFLSIEPLMGPVNFTMPIPCPIELFIIGAMTGPGAVKPKREWIDSIKRSLPSNKIFWKNNIRNI
jgi:protein gp37